MTAVPPDVYARLEALEAQVAHLAQHLGLAPPPPGPPTPSANVDLPSEIVHLVSTGRKIQAIKRYREMYGVGLKEAKDGVEAIEASTRGPLG